MGTNNIALDGPGTSALGTWQRQEAGRDTLARGAGAGLKLKIAKYPIFRVQRSLENVALSHIEADFPSRLDMASNTHTVTILEAMAF